MDADVHGVFQGSLHALVESGALEVDETGPELTAGAEPPAEDKGEENVNED